MIGRPCVFFEGRTNEGALFDPRYIIGMRMAPVTVGAFFRIERSERAGLDHFLSDPIVFSIGSIAYMNTRGMAKGFDLIDEMIQWHDDSTGLSV